MKEDLLEQPFKYFLNTTDKAMLFHMINVGQGLMILIVFPDETTMLFDCYITNEKEEEIIQYLKQYIPIRKDENDQDEQWIDIFVNSHRDKDHYKGLKVVNSNFKIKSIWDSGQYGTGAKSGDDDYKYYMYLKREIKKTYGEESVPQLYPSTDPFKVFGDTKIYCLNSKEDVKENVDMSKYSFFSFDENNNYENFINEDKFDINNQIQLSENALKVQHTNCLVLMIEYSGKRLLLTGDSDWNSWRESIVPNFSDANLVKSNILIASHHGSRSFFTDEKNESIDIDKNPDTTYLEHIDLISPQITLISCGEYSTYHHPNSEALEIYKDKTSNSQVYYTNDKQASFIGFIRNDGYWGVTTSDFRDYKSDSDIEFTLECKSTRDGYTSDVDLGSTLIAGCELQFTAKNIKKIADSLVKENVNVTWEVSNSGNGDHEEHQELYFVGKEKKKCSYTAEETRDLSYNGTHLMRCTIENKDRNKKITKVFYLNGMG